jgi:hypothetical protein
VKGKVDAPLVIGKPVLECVNAERTLSSSRDPPARFAGGPNLNCVYAAAGWLPLSGRVNRHETAAIPTAPAVPSRIAIDDRARELCFERLDFFLERDICAPFRQCRQLSCAG